MFTEARLSDLCETSVSSAFQKTVSKYIRNLVPNTKPRIDRFDFRSVFDVSAEAFKILKAVLTDF